MVDPIPKKERNTLTSTAVLKRRDRILYALKLFGNLQVVFIAIGLLLIAAAIFLLSRDGFGKRSAILYSSLIGVINILAGVLFLTGVNIAKVELVYTYLFVNAFWAIIFGAILLMFTFSHSVSKPGTAFLVIAFIYNGINCLWILTTFYLITTLKRTTRRISVNSKRSISLFSKTETITEVPVRMAGAPNQTDSEMTEATLKFNESRHAN